MKWQLSEPKCADMIRVRVGGIYHYGIYVTDEEVIQFGPRPDARGALFDSEIEVIASHIDEFLGGGFIEVCELDRKERRRARSPEDTVKYARSRLGARGYNIIHNNCEHFAHECLLREHKSTQTEQLRERFRSIPIVDVYVARLPEALKRLEIFSKERRTELFSVTNERVKREKYYAWRLLEYAAERSLGIKARKATFKKTPNGAWISDELEFSISHSRDAIAVAVSRAAVGVDIECDVAPRAENFAARILTEKEFSEYSALEEENKSAYLTELWTAKEAVFKKTKGERFIPSKIAPSEHSVSTTRINLLGNEYTLSVATDTPEKIKLIENVMLEET